MAGPGLPRVFLAASVDTEEDNWTPVRSGVTVSNIAALPAVHTRLSGLGLRITYFAAHSVVTDAAASAVLRTLASAGAEIGAHLHPWNTPPFSEAMVGRNSMLKNLPADLQSRKLEHLTRAVESAIGDDPKVFRAGRFGIGPDAIAALVRLGYLADSSVTPWVDWSENDDGPDFFGAPQQVYRVSGDTNVTVAAPDGALIEVPMSTGFNRWPFERSARIHRWLRQGVMRRLRLGGVAHRTGVLRRILLSPEGTDVAGMLRLARVLVSHDVKHLQIMWHSPSLVAGLTPFARSSSEVRQLVDNICAFVEGLHAFAHVTFATVGETAAALGQSPA
jgi:hypothetical protein